MMSGENNNRTTTKTNVVPLLAMQKGGFCNVKVWFLHAKNHTFAAQKGGFSQSIVIQIVTQYCFSRILFPL